MQVWARGLATLHLTAGPFSTVRWLTIAGLLQHQKNPAFLELILVPITPFDQV
jgi:hypothetical protein